MLDHIGREHLGSHDYLRQVFTLRGICQTDYPFEYEREAFELIFAVPPAPPPPPGLARVN